MPGVSAVVLAAGKSSRMGGPNKLLLPWGCSTVIGTTVGALRKCDVDIVVVTGRDADAVTKAVKPVRTVHNKNFEQGMGTSIAKGVQNCPEENAILIVLGDMPELDSALVEQLISTYQDPKDIVVPVYSQEPDRPGHPVVFGCAYRTELVPLQGDEGARRVIEANRVHLKKVNFEGALDDLNTREDLSSQL